MKQGLGSRISLSEDAARQIAISGLAYIANDTEELGRFLALTGMVPSDFRQAAAEPGFLVGVLDFFMGHEPTLIKFAESSDIDPNEIFVARQILAGPEGDQ